MTHHSISFGNEKKKNLTSFNMILAKSMSNLCKVSAYAISSAIQQSYSQFDTYRNERLEEYSLESKREISQFFYHWYSTIIFCYQRKVLKANFQKSYHLQQVPCATGLWLLVQQRSQQKEPCYSFYLLH